MNLKEFRQLAAEQQPICCWICHLRQATHHKVGYIHEDLTLTKESSLCDPCYRAACLGDFSFVDDLEAAVIRRIHEEQIPRIEAYYREGGPYFTAPR